MNLPAIQINSPKIKSSIELAIDVMNNHLTGCRTCRLGLNGPVKTACPTGNNLMHSLDQAIVLEQITN